MGCVPKVGEIYCLNGPCENAYRIIKKVENRIVHYSWLIYDSETNIVNESYDSNVINLFLFWQLFNKSFSDSLEFQNHFNIKINQNPKQIKFKDVF